MASGDLNQASGIPWICESPGYVNPNRCVDTLISFPADTQFTLGYACYSDRAGSYYSKCCRASEGRFLEIQTCRPHTRPNESEFAFEQYPQTTQMYRTFEEA